VSPKSRPKSPPASSKSKTGAAKRPATAPKNRARGAQGPNRASAATKPRISFAWLVAGVVLVALIVVAVVAASSGGGSSASSSGGASTPASAELVRNTKAASVPLLDQEGLATHIHTTLKVVVDGKNKQVPAFIGIDAASGKIAALHTHDASGLIHLESAKENDDYSLDQFLTVWGMPKDAAGRCAFFGATSPCTLTVKSKDSGTVGLDVPLKDYDTLTLTVTST
jgi:hypothetical protein